MDIYRYLVTKFISLALEDDDAIESKQAYMVLYFVEKFNTFAERERETSSSKAKEDRKTDFFT